MRALCAALLSCALAAFAAGQPSRPGATAGATAPFEFNGLVRAGDRTLVCVTTVPERHSRWIAVGEQLDGIRVTRFDPEAQQIVVEASGRSHTITLKTPAAGAPPNAGAFGAVSTGPLPVATVARTAVTNEEKEREARMLVSDLLEIGMIQRKAYEEAQKKAAAEKAREKNGK